MNEKGKNKRLFSLGTKLTLLVILMAATLSVATIVLGYQTYKRSMHDHFVVQGENLARTAARWVNGDRLPIYLVTDQTDEEYDRTLEMLRMLQRENNVEYFYVVLPTEDGTYYIYDTDESEDRCDLGYFEEWYDAFAPSSAAFIRGDEIPPLVSNESFGWLLSVYAPIRNSAGNVAGYMGADFNMDKVIQDRLDYLVSLIILTVVITVAFVFVWLYAIRKTVISPINGMAKAADEFLVEQPDGQSSHASSLSALNVHTNDEIEMLAGALKSMELKINQYILNLAVATKRAETDDLTGLYKREAFEQRVSSFLLTEGSDQLTHAFLMIDLDNFKQINDTYGHLIGDEALRQCADALKRVFRSVDEVVRMGGDEFAVFCKSVGDVQMVQNKARLLCETIRQIRIDGMDGRVLTVSVGGALVPKDGVTYQELYQKADKALYQSKLEGRDRFVLYK